MTKTLGQLSTDIKDFFKLTFIPKFGIGRKVSPVYLVNPAPAMQAVAVVDAALTQNTWYTLLDTTDNVMIWAVMVNQDTADESIQFKFTFDGNSPIATIAATNCAAGATNYP